MSVSALDSSLPLAPTQPEMETYGKSELERSDFMTLFITQLQYQDPLKPMDSYEMASQLAQFSNMEATMKMADNMEQLLDYQTSQNNLQLLTLLDKEVRVAGNVIGVNEDTMGSGEFTLLEDADACTVEIYDSGDHLIRTIDMRGSTADTYILDWDRKNSLGEEVADGAYAYVVNAFDVNGKEIEVDYQTVGQVTGLDFESGQALLQLDGHVSVDVGVVTAVN